jgi:hypothetical protein
MRAPWQPADYRAALDGLARAASAFASRGGGAASRRFLHAIDHLLNTEGFSKQRAEQVHGHLTTVSLSVVLVRPIRDERAASSPAAGPLDVLELAGVYIGGGEPLFLLPGGLFFQPRRLLGSWESAQERAGRWVVTGSGVEMTGFWHWTSDVVFPFSGYQRFRADATAAISVFVLTPKSCPSLPLRLPRTPPPPS